MQGALQKDYHYYGSNVNPIDISHPILSNTALHFDCDLIRVRQCCHLTMIMKIVSERMLLVADRIPFLVQKSSLEFCSGIIWASLYSPLFFNKMLFKFTAYNHTLF